MSLDNKLPGEQKPLSDISCVAHSPKYNAQLRVTAW